MRNLWARVYSILQTTKHKLWVLWYISKVCGKLLKRGIVHDFSKYDIRENRRYASVIFKLKHLTYGSEEYFKYLKKIKPATIRHYKINRHHPEHHPNGMKDMTVVDLIEAMADWKAATKRHNDGCIRRSIESNQNRFGYDDETKRLLLSIVEDLE